MNRMRCKPPDGKAWTTVRVRELRERLGIAPFDPSPRQIEARHLCRRCAGARLCAAIVCFCSIVQRRRRSPRA